MPEDHLFQTVARYGVVPVIAIDSVDSAIPLADALLEGGLPLAEITFRTAAAAEVIERISQQRPELVIGAGTVLTGDTVKTAKSMRRSIRRRARNQSECGRVRATGRLAVCAGRMHAERH
jgi:2-keto-3-deoxy-6-phosphogluconate aldolase